jgi:hypothetical protein
LQTFRGFNVTSIEQTVSIRRSSAWHDPPLDSGLPGGLKWIIPAAFAFV